MLVHGFTQTGRSWAPVVAELATRCPLEVSTPDLPGHGDAAAQRPASLAAAATALGDSAGRGTYVGYSMGARLCLRLALDRPELVERLVLVGATPGLAEGAEREARRAADEALASRVEQTALPDFLDEWLAGPLFAHLSPEQAGREARLANTTAGLAFALRRFGTGAEPSMWPRLGELAMPLLVVAGGRDERYAVLAARIAAAGPVAPEVALLAGAGHAAPFEQPAAFAELVVSWLERLTARGR